MHDWNGKSGMYRRLVCIPNGLDLKFSFLYIILFKNAHIAIQRRPSQVVNCCNESHDSLRVLLSKQINQKITSRCSFFATGNSDIAKPTAQLFEVIGLLEDKEFPTPQRNDATKNLEWSIGFYLPFSAGLLLSANTFACEWRWS